jgi:hypothetical protein
MTNEELIKNAETMFGTGSKKHLKAIKRFGAKKSVAVPALAAAKPLAWDIGFKPSDF